MIFCFVVITYLQKLMSLDIEIWFSGLLILLNLDKVKSVHAKRVCFIWFKVNSS